MNRIEHHLLNMYVIITYLLQLRKHQYLKRSIYFCVKVGRNHRRDVNHLPFGTRSIDKFSFRISTRGNILVFDGRECDKQIDYFRAIRARTDCIEAEYCMSLCFNGKTLTYLSRYFLLPFFVV